VFTEIIGTVVFGVLLFVRWGVHAKPTPYGAGILTNTASALHYPTWYAFALAGLLGAFTLVGFELAADMSEDAVNPARHHAALGMAHKVDLRRAGRREHLGHERGQLARRGGDVSRSLEVRCR